LAQGSVIRDSYELLPTSFAMFALVLASVASAGLLRSLKKVDGKDPYCKTGVMEASLESPRICCPSFCNGECSDYKTCSSAFEFDHGKSSNACCASVVRNNSCDLAGENGLTAVTDPPCTLSCEESLPPCIMTDASFDLASREGIRNAADDCGDAVKDWMNEVKTATSVLQTKVEVGLQVSKVGKCFKDKDHKCLCEMQRENQTIGIVHLK